MELQSGDDFLMRDHGLFLNRAGDGMINSLNSEKTVMLSVVLARFAAFTLTRIPFITDFLGNFGSFLSQ